MKEEEKTIKTSSRLPQTLHTAWKKRAADPGETMNKILIRALSKELGYPNNNE